MKTIIIHHLQEMWDVGLKKLGTSFDEMMENVVQHLREVKYDYVIVTNFEAGFNLDEEQYQLSEFNTTVHDYMYGWEREEVEGWGEREEGVDFVEGGSHSEVVLVYQWMRELSGEIHLCGAFDGECIEDMEIALLGAGKEFKRIEELIV